LFGRIASGTFAIGHYLAAPYLTLDAPDAPPMAAITIGQSTASVAFDGMVSVFDACAHSTMTVAGKLTRTADILKPVRIKP
jgi:hypothetical protein